MRETKFQVLDRTTFKPIWYDILDDIGWSMNGQWGVRRQYTGLKDKNGEEIYFWDILATSNDNPEYDIWTEEEYGYTIVREDDEFLWVTFSRWWPTNEKYSLYDFRFVRVVWNICENPELITK